MVFDGLCFRHGVLANVQICILGDTGFFRHQGIVKATVSGVFEDLKFKISEGSG